MWATRDQFYKCWRKQRLKNEEKERWILMLSSFTFQQEQGKKDRSKLLTWLKMTYNNRVLSSTLLRILLRSGSVDKTTSESHNRVLSLQSCIGSLIFILDDGSSFWFQIEPHKLRFGSVSAYPHATISVPVCRELTADTSFPCCQYTEREKHLTYRYRWTVTVPITRHHAHACILQSQMLDMSTQIRGLH